MDKNLLEENDVQLSDFSIRINNKNELELDFKNKTIGFIPLKDVENQAETSFWTFLDCCRKK